MRNLGTDDEVAKNRKNLVGIEYPLVPLQVIDLVELLDLFIHHFGTREDDLHLVDRSHRFLQLVQNQLAVFIRLVISDIGLIQKFLRITLIANGILQRQLVQTELFSHKKCLRSTVL